MRLIVVAGTDCPAIDGLIKESDETSGEIDDKSVLDAAIVASERSRTGSSDEVQEALLNYVAMQRFVAI
jgi:hypothetical protein